MKGGVALPNDFFVAEKWSEVPTGFPGSSWGGAVTHCENRQRVVRFIGNHQLLRTGS